MSMSVIDKKLELKRIINECKGWDSINRFLDICSLNPIDFNKNLDTKTNYLSVTKVHIDKIVNNACADVNKKEVKERLYNLFNFTDSIEVYRNHLYWVDFGKGIGSEQGDIRPAYVVQNNVGNRYSPTVTVIPTTCQIKAKHLPTHVIIDEIINSGLPKDSIILVEQIRTIDKSRIKEYIGECPYYLVKFIDKAIRTQLDIPATILDISEFVENFVQKYELKNKFKYALAISLKAHCEENGIEMKNNVDGYILEARKSMMLDKIADVKIVLPKVEANPQPQFA